MASLTTWIKSKIRLRMHNLNEVLAKELRGVVRLI